jgi:hypothetical protein
MPKTKAKPTKSTAKPKTKKPATKPSTRAQPALPTPAPTVASPEAVPAEIAPPTPSPATTKEPRLPPVGTVLRKVDRNGTTRSEAAVVEGGILYKGTVYRSLSAAAIAAARDQGKQSRTMNGWAYWGLTKPVRSTSSPLAAIDRAFERYHAQVTKRLESETSDDREVALAALLRHARVLQNLHDEIRDQRTKPTCSTCGGAGEVTADGQNRPCGACQGEGIVRTSA